MGENRPCGQGRRCVDGIDTGDPHWLNPRWGPGPFCARDTELIDRALRDLPRLYVELHLELGTTSSPAGPRVSGTSAPRLPISVYVDTLLGEVHATVVSWHEVCADVVGAQPPPARRAGPMVDAGCLFLRAHLGSLLELPATSMVRDAHIWDLDGVDAGRELLKLHGRLRTALGKNHEVQVRPAPCEHCGAYALLEAAAGIIQCQVCRRVMNETQYDAWCALLTGNAG